ncbi:MAG: MBL fold metallo-hydrolase [Bryobacteraceae bacterium]|nr:MBL fold metallo-hydrolase [Bryobacteraceae bacterium]
MKRILAVFLLLAFFALCLPAAKTLDMYVVDVEGGKALILISPGGQSMLIDAGFPGFNDRDAIRIEEAAKAAGIFKFDYLVVTHYDSDHVNNVPATVARIPAAVFADHGTPVVKDPGTLKAVAAYEEVAAKGKHIVVKPGDKIPFGPVDVLVVTSGGEMLRTPVKGGGIPNPFCAETQPMSWGRVNEDASENAASVGLLFTYGKFRMLDLADLTWNKEIELMCPTNPIGTVDLFMVSHHGHNISNSPALVNAIQPRVTVMNNGAKKMGTPEVLQRLKSLPGMQANYQLHWSANAPNDNPPEEFIANLQNSPDGKWLKISAQDDGTIVVTNARTGGTKTFKK